ncbi:MAG: hypothetical protein ACRD3O_22140, partial [Terriglobia bacterium]
MNRRQFVNSLGASTVLSAFTPPREISSTDSADLPAIGAARKPVVKITSPFLEVSLDSTTGMWKCASRREGQLFERVIAGAETSIGSFQTSNPHLARNASA